MPSAPPPKMDLFSKLAGHADLQSNEAGGYEGQAHTPRLDDNMFAVTSDGYGYDIGSSGLPDPMQTYGTNSDGVSSNYGSFDSNHATFGSNSSDFSAYDFSSFGGSVYRGPDGNEWHNGYPVGPSTPVQAAMDMSQALQTPFYTMGEQASTAVPRVMDFNGKTSSKKKKKSKKTSSGMPQDSGSNKAKQEDLNMPLPKYQSNNTEMQSLHGDGMINIANNKGHMSGYGAPASHAHPVRNFSLPNLPIYQGASYPPTTTNEESNALAVWPSNSQRSDASFTTDLADLHVGNDNRLFSENFSTAPGLITANDMPDWASDRADYDFDGSITTYNHHDTYNKLYGSNGQRYYAPVQDANVSVPSYANAFIYSDDQAMPTINHDDNLTALGFAQDDEDSKKAHRKL